ncbi:endonuclease I [Janibacter hoylei PVAS-1]|uniref:Endonuclease I n=1 Tax=Janibacter hoylei PVAS-1 TaxID=1210046 RepID=K1E6V8_9MICO|nr:endonuclease [Janibacter hoylei]EKA62776.1 endonuclease I [Janibacter hoylei PVAS-1]RWU84347.1 ribonuclease [Janibacter hoylei PVAS-1]
MSRTIRRLVGISAAAALVALPSLPSQALTVTAATSQAAATPLTVTAALGQQDGATQTVRGYVVGQPTATDRVVTSGFPNDYAIAIAATPGETDTGKMLYVQVPSALRSQWGLASNPDLVGQQVDVTGALEAYFSHAGVTGTSAIALADGTAPEEPEDPGEPTDPGSYYDGTAGLTGSALKSRLHDIISTHTVLSYDQVWDGIKDVDEDPQDTSSVVLLYKGTSSPKSNNGGGVDNWNREHVWAKSHGDFGTSNGPGTDLHHLRPTDVTVNSDRGNLDFDNGGSENGEAAGNYSDSDSWEPRDEVKGDVARMIFYMAVRYESGDRIDLEVNDQVNNGSNPYMGRLSVLKQWSQEDPPDAFEQRRNERIFDNWQGNRNPFIDHPEWVESIW